MSRGGVHVIVKRYGAAIGVPELSPHDMRRTAAQAWYDAIHDLVLVQELLGHASVNTTRQYLCLDAAKKHEAVRAVKWGMRNAEDS